MVRWWVRQGGETKGQPLCLMMRPSDTALASEGRGAAMANHLQQPACARHSFVVRICCDLRASHIRERICDGQPALSDILTSELYCAV